MAHQASSAPQNYFGISDPRALDEIAGELAALRLFELEHGEPLTIFTRADFCWVHRYLLQDIYPGTILLPATFCRSRQAATALVVWDLEDRRLRLLRDALRQH